MKRNLTIFVSLILTFFLLNYGCNTEPVTSATSADGVTINFSNTGKGEPAIVLVHGWTNNNTIWDLQVPVLSEKYQVLAVDLAGHGQSGNNRSDWTMSAFGQDIAAVVKAAKAKKVILVGFSLGGPAVLEAAKLIPDQLEGVILTEGINDPDQKYPPPVVHFIDSLFMDMIAHVNVEKLQQYGFVVKNPEEALDKVKKMVDRDQTGWEDILLENFRWSNEDLVDALKALNVPLITINADYQPTAEDNFRKYVTDYDAKYVSGSGHVMMWDVTDDLNNLLMESIQEIINKQ